MSSDIPKEIFTALRQMDHEANTIRHGAPTGLNWYGPHARPELKRPQTEAEWSKRLAHLLSEAGLPTEAEVPYPDDRRKRCDLVVRLPGADGGRTWIEIKGAWKHYWSTHGGLGIYRSYLLHPFVPGLMAKSHTVPNDITKLSSLTSKEAAAIAILLVGFDTQESAMDEDVEELISKSSLHEPAWAIATDSWPDSRRPGQRVRCWLWSTNIA